MKIALSQMAMTDQKEENLRKSLDVIQKAAEESADLVFFPEVQLTKFFPQYHREGKDISGFLTRADGPEVRAFQEACRANHIAASPNMYMEDQGRNYDTSLMIDAEGELLGTSKMVHVADFPNFHEQDYYTPSDSGFKVYDLDINGEICRVGIVICFDRHLPESIRICALKGADLILVPTANLFGEPGEMFQWEMRVQAMQNSVNIAMCNRVGEEDAIAFCGESLIIDYHGSITALAGADEELLIGDVDLKAAHDRRIHHPYITSRRPEVYEEEL